MDRSEAIQFIRVRRETVVRDVLREFSRFGRNNLEKRLIVMYEGESGVDAGGLTKDMFTRFFSQLFAEHIGMFVASEDGSSGTTGEVGLEAGERTYLPSPSCELVSYMEALGKVLAKVVMDGHTIDAKFAPVLYKYLINGDTNNGTSTTTTRYAFFLLSSHFSFCVTLTLFFFSSYNNHHCPTTERTEMPLVFQIWNRLMGSCLCNCTTTC